MSSSLVDRVAPGPNLDLVVDRGGDHLEIRAADGSIRVERIGSLISLSVVNHPGEPMKFTLTAAVAQLVARHVLDLAAALVAERSRQGREPRPKRPRSKRTRISSGSGAGKPRHPGERLW
jgi:hypothetical protein